MRTYVSTMGFHETRVTRPVLRHGLDDGDRVVLLRPDVEADGDRSADAVDYVVDMLHEIAPGATVEVERINQAEFPDAIVQCCDVIDAAAGELVVNFGGGAREVFLPLTVATILYAQRVDVALQYTDVDQSVREWEVPNLTASVPTERWQTLETIRSEGPEVSISELDEHLAPTKSTISRHVSGLAEADLVTTSMRGKTKHVSITLGGRLLLGQSER